jgi:hypothetical protein
VSGISMVKESVFAGIDGMLLYAAASFFMDGLLLEDLRCVARSTP